MLTIVLPKFGSEPIPNAELRSSSGRVRFKVRGILRTKPVVRSGVRAVEERFEHVRTREPMLLLIIYFLMQRRSLLAALKNQKTCFYYACDSNSDKLRRDELSKLSLPLPQTRPGRPTKANAGPRKPTSSSSSSRGGGLETRHVSGPGYVFP